MVDVEINGASISVTDIDALLDAQEQIENEIRARAADELEAIERRKQRLNALLGTGTSGAPAVAEPVVEPPAAPKRRRREPINPPKYYNPVNPEQTWTGRGKAPKWFRDCVPVPYHQNISAHPTLALH